MKKKQYQPKKKPQNVTLPKPKEPGDIRGARGRVTFLEKMIDIIIRRRSKKK